MIDECSENNPKLENLFFIRTNKIFECKKGHKVKKEEPSTFLIVPEKFDQNISSYIFESEKPDHFNGKNKIYCSVCKSLMEITVTKEHILPEILAMYFVSENPKKRNIRNIEIFKGKEYMLYGVICFYPPYSHYVASTLDKGTWREYNDKFVSEKEPDFNYAYMVFYRKVK
ncbi:unnamed protein product [Blepharisma stoltei]|uniref:USP domain-containing protein n=1 Tax=Blepharisma stoltei TaxID=1481888 RepID=A0AAU9IIR6_9CILI|nr:unnamed protein product [Blepharisma stoltei]